VQICFNTQRHEFATLVATYAVFFATYLVVLNKTKTDADLVFFLKIGLILRGVAVFSFPNLSDDIYRFLWDGHLVNLGENPFSHPPQYYVDNQLFTERLTPELFSKINSPKYYSVYPTVSQAVFAVATYLFPKSVYGAAVVIKLFLFGCEAGTLFLMKKLIPTTFQKFQTFGKLRDNTFNIGLLIYALNPLIIIELIGNAHFEAAMIFFFIGAVFLLKNTEGGSDRVTLSHPITMKINVRNIFLSAAVFALSIVSKMLPLMFLPLFLKKLGWRRSFYFWITVGLLTLILLSPIYNALFFDNIGKSLALYFNNFEFNASIFYVLKSIGIWIYGYDMIGQLTPFLTAIVVFFILKKTFFSKTNDTISWDAVFFDDCLMVISVYFACATTVHPWYAAFPLACSVFTTWRFPMVWTFFIFLTYGNYTEGSSKHTENYWIVFVEYLAVYGFFIFEWWRKKQKR
jgi:alpha-1,6-mannosyltransferase